MKQNFELRYASHPDDAKMYDTEENREMFLVETVLAPDEINMVYSMYDRLIVGGAMPVKEVLELTAPEEIRAQYFLERRELGMFNVGGPGEVVADKQTFRLDHKDALYLGKGVRTVAFKSLDASNPAKFYFNSAPAHAAYLCRKVTKADAEIRELGALETSNHRIINRMLVLQVLPTCQLQMGMTELQTGSVWNTMPPHTHNRRMEAYFYFDLPEKDAVCHFMGEPEETRHLWMKNEQAVISPQWSIHSACATHNYTFIWGMAGENIDYDDMDGCAATDLK
ncbi:MAG: 5-dehydro-4-deoxy-D-glucuronate isomerase [Rikenellaceae bacterium]|nr:5-dehydro-4-deoxy-D-glucuronate isomerase [Rikenellaceae bacterium]